MDRRVTVVVVILFLALGGYVWWTFLRADAPPVAAVTPEPTPIPFLNLTPDDVTAVEIRDVKANQVVRVARSGEEWQMESPKQGPADSNRVSSLLFQLASIDATRELQDVTDLAQYGLNPPLHELRVTLEDGSTQVVQLGEENPDQTSVYATKPGATSVFLIRASTGEAVAEFVTTPPFTPTPTATAEPTGTPAPTTPTPGGTGTPTASATPPS
jgi:hypothetical protein